MSVEQYSPIRLGVPNSFSVSDNYDRSGPSREQELSNLYIAVQDAKKYGAGLGDNYLTRSTRNGQDFCDKL